MKTKSLTLLALFLCMNLSFAQSFETDTESKTEVSKLHFMAGKWKGEGWMYTPDRQKMTFKQTENIQFKLDSTTLLIEGLGMNEGKIVHNAMAIVSYDKEQNLYSFRSYLQNGRKGEFKGELIDGKFYWYPNDNMRYIIALNDQGQWYETGEYKRENDWFQFFEMTLNKVD
ncbi:hypothetical protein [Marinigracilibium pacificum]|uniref:DUF1579 domain-containing protein n=1 Tax=Marinigracilibium pacificum TaxID=2729599 RepID=A0A848J1Q2_9BACT|nr:hypothetical protein [Marinigracilibium pacificum]NMM50497.1 hypothetical protein [Marinigracilibium pacificum]